MIFDLPCLEREQPGAEAGQKAAPRDRGARRVQRGWGSNKGGRGGRGGLRWLCQWSPLWVHGGRSRSQQRGSCTSTVVDGVRWKKLASVVFPMSKLQLTA